DHRYEVIVEEYPKERPYRDGERIRPSCARWIFCVAHTGKRVRELDGEANRAANYKRQDRLSEYPDRALIEAANNRLGVPVSVDEVLEAVIDSQQRMLSEVGMEIPWGVERDRVRLNPSPIEPVPPTKKS
ncbi:MAG TPA: hypothetical protein VGB90_06070, partial [Alphaproteobacteria bacterium]